MTVDEVAVLRSELAAERAGRAADRAEAELAIEAARVESNRLVRMVSHDVRTPLNNILGAIELAEMLAARPADFARWMAVARSSVTRMRLMIDDLVAYARDTLVQPLVMAPVAVADVVRAAAAEVMTLEVAAERHIQVDLDGLNEPASVTAHHDALRQALVDLLFNAILHRTEGDVEIAASRHDGRVRFSVTGPVLVLEPREAAAVGAAADEFRKASDPFAITVATGIIARHGATLQLSADGDRFTAEFTLDLAS